jgi:hypothetical protein
MWSAFQRAERWSERITRNGWSPSERLCAFTSANTRSAERFFRLPHPGPGVQPPTPPA